MFLVNIFFKLFPFFDCLAKISSESNEKISYSNQTKKNIYYLKPQMFEYYKLINKIEIPNYSCYLNVYQK